ncbi:MAG: class I SAM-dependent methyltransferase [Myxococcota bacterium]
MGRGKKQRKKQKTRRRTRETQAKHADKYDLYQRSVQEPAADAPFVSRVFKKHFGRPPRTLREDFCGTAALACHWVERHDENVATGIDLDPEPLAWGREHNLSKLTAEQASRVKLIEGDVLDVGNGGFDVSVAFNFSYMIFKERPLLLEYCRKAHATLGSEGIFVMDAYGGADAQRTLEETRECDGFDYVWDQDIYDPIQARAVNYIHFEFDDGSRLQRAFRYDWRLWGLAELRDLLSEAGFAKTEVYWEGTDRKTGEGNDIYLRRESAEDDPAYVCYIAGIR